MTGEGGGRAPEGIPALALGIGQPWQHGLLGDEALSVRFSLAAQLGDLRRIEIAAVEARAALGLVDADAARVAIDVIRDTPIEPATLARGAARDGVVVPVFVEALRTAAPPSARPHVHAGLTSQDVVDGAALLVARDVNALLDARLERVLERIDALARAHGANPLGARTRMQLARPITVADRLNAWAAPLARHRTRLAELAPRSLVFGLGGADGTGRTIERAEEIGAHMARALGLEPGAARHAQRDGWIEYGGWLGTVCGLLGKVGADVALMAQQGIDEIALEGGGGSSAMPHKRNPVAAEILVTLARFAAALVGALGGALVHEQERSGAAWTLEWIAVPQLQLAAAVASARALAMLDGVVAIGTPDV